MSEPLECPNCGGKVRIVLENPEVVDYTHNLISIEDADKEYDRDENREDAELCPLCHGLVIAMTRRPLPTWEQQCGERLAWALVPA